MNILKEVENAITNYLAARNCLLSLATKHPQLLGGNDNIIGRIGEYIAIKFLWRSGRKPLRPKNKSQKGFDLLVGKSKVSVKIITTENKRGRGARIKKPWDELIVIYFDTKTCHYLLGLLSKRQFLDALQKNKRMSSEPIVKKTMLSSKGLIGRYGKTTEGRL